MSMVKNKAIAERALTLQKEETLSREVRYLLSDAYSEAVQTKLSAP